MKNAYIKAISYYLPEKILSNEGLAKEFPEWSVEKVTSKIGISERHIAGENECASDLAYNAAIKMFEEHSVNPENIDFILLCTQSPDYYLPTTACILQNKLGIPTTAGALDFNLGCSGYVYGLSLAKGLIFAGVAKNILLLTAETYTKHIHPKDKGNRAIFGDGASATLISTDGFAEIENFSFGTDGKGAENLIIKTGGLRNPNKLNDSKVDSEGTHISSDHLYMNGAEIFTFTLANVPMLVQDTLKKNELNQSDISLFVFHQANKHMMNFLRQKIKIEEDKFYYCLEKSGNTVSSTIPIALSEAKMENKLNNYVLLAGFGVGYSWGGVILKINL
jgi:3-oxoacyl-[acyl-carrier-protein] synthase III